MQYPANVIVIHPELGNWRATLHMGGEPQFYVDEPYEALADRWVSRMSALYAGVAGLPPITFTKEKRA